MKRDVGMACQKYTNKKGYKSKGKYTKPRPYIFTLLQKDVGMDEALYSIVSCTYLMIIFDVDINSFIHKVFHFFQITLLGCHV